MQNIVLLPCLLLSAHLTPNKLHLNHPRQCTKYSSSRIPYNLTPTKDSTEARVLPHILMRVSKPQDFRLVSHHDRFSNS